MNEMRVNVVGFDSLSELYEHDPNFREAWFACKNLVELDRTPWLEYFIQENLLFKENKLCIPRGFMRENLIREKHSGGLGGHFGIDKTTVLLSESYYWPRMSVDIKKMVQGCRIC